MIQLSLPMRVMPVSCTVPQLKVQYSRMVLRSPISSPYASPPLDHHMRPDRGPFAYLDMLADDRIGAHRYSESELRSGMNDGRRVNHIGRSVHKIFASAASASPTRAWAANFQS